MPEPRPDRCATCRLWRILNNGGGECRRYPPTLVFTSARRVWPETDADDWCGEWQVQRTIDAYYAGTLDAAPEPRKT